MKYISLDLETTSAIDKCPENILMFSMVLEDTNNQLPLDQLPHFTCFVNSYQIKGEAFALSMNSWILDIISKRKENTTNFEIIPLELLDYKVNNFLNEYFSPIEKINVAGKNLGVFDINFLSDKIKSRISNRIIDVGNFFIDFKNDKRIPDLKTCKERAGLSGEVSHNAYEDALDNIKLLRTKYG